MSRLKWIRCFSLLLIACNAAALFPRSAAEKKGNSRLTVLISDLHLGVGKTEGGAWHNYEDARWATEFSIFLKEMDRLGGGAADLILNGDTFELWQSLESDDCLYPNKDLGCTEADALKRLRKVLSAHDQELRAIGNFANSGDNRVVMVPGNHDAALLFSAVAEEVLKALGANKDRARIATDGYWISSDRLIYAEHGHQIGREVNKFDDWPNPFKIQNGRKHLQRTWGEQFVQGYFNAFELKYPIIDNFSEEPLGIKYGAAAEGSNGLVKDFGRFARFYLMQLSWSQLESSLGPEAKTPDWDVPSIRKGGNRFFVESLQADDPLRAAAEQAVKEGVWGLSISDLTDDELGNICNLRYVWNQQGLRVESCPRKSLGAIGQRLFSSRDAIFKVHLDNASKSLSSSDSEPVLFELFVFSHTHVADAGFRPLQASPGQWNPLVVNTGAWQRTVNPAQFQVLLKRSGIDAKSALAKLKPEDLPACYPVILVPTYTIKPKSMLRYWVEDKKGWSLKPSCD